MFKYDKLKEAIDNINKTHPEWYPELQRNWDILVEVMTEDVNASILFLENQCTVEEIIELSSVFDEIIKKTQSKKLLNALYITIEKYKNHPDIKRYRVREMMIYAEQALLDENK